ncbi:AFG1/ZapE family ATPase [Candidatus Williamhamiltonella defendens]|uniref:AFG1/ZapE family ATPase n=1 Tax=Candidatus Williamhamiltonella defendens TaxID=138072 RepID=UPI00387E44E1
MTILHDVLVLIDEFYARKVNLIISAQVSISEFFRGKYFTFEYRRCVSRLKDMQIKSYLSQPHLS